MIRLSAAALTLALSALPLCAADVAILIGNETYENAPEIGRVLRNQDRLAATLRQAGYRVFAGKDLTLAATRDLFAEADGFLPEAGRLLVVYAGHAVNSGRETWLAPVDLAAERLSDAEFGAVSLDFVLDLLARHPGKAALFLGLPVEGFEPSGALGAGLGPLEVPQGVLVVRGDPDAVHAALTADFLGAGMTPFAAMQESAEDLDYLGFVSPDLTLGRAPDAAPVANGAAAILAERAFWALAEQADRTEDYQEYLARYPDGLYADSARARIAALAAPKADPAAEAEADLGLSAADRRRVQEQLTVLGYNPRGVDGVFGVGTRAAISAWQRNEGLDQTGFLTHTQLAALSRQAKARADALAAEAERARQERAAADAAYWRATGANGSAADLRAYLARYPDGIYAAEARDGLDRIEALEREQAERADRAAWDEARSVNTVRAYQRYLDLYPRGAFAEIARARIRDLENDSGIEDDLEELQAIEANLGLNAASRMLVERRLAALGHDPGPVDGDFTRRTRSAIRAFQQATGIEATGYLNAFTVRQLIVAAAN